MEENVAQGALCLDDKFMELAHDEPTLHACPHIPNVQYITWMCYVWIWCEPGELEEISRVTSGLSGY